MKLAIVVEHSGNAKLSANGNVSSTSVAQQSCHESCPLLNAGCYGQHGRQNLHTIRLNTAAKARKKSKEAIRLLAAKAEAEGIRALSGLRKLRRAVVGDSATPATATITGTAMMEHEAKHGKLAWGYTHSWRVVDLAHWMGARILASCNNTREIAEARARGYAASVIVPKHQTNKIYVLDGEKILPCPAQFKHNGRRAVTCEHCTLCQRPDWLRQNKISIGFQPDAGTEKRVMRMLEVR